MKNKIIVAILIIIAFTFWLFVNSIMQNISENTNEPTNKNNSIGDNNNDTSFNEKDITIIYDDRCLDCNIQTMVTELRQIPFLQWYSFNLNEYTQDNMEDFLMNNNVDFLPAVIFNTKEAIPEMEEYLVELPNWQYSLEVWAKFDPFQERSDKWFLELDAEIVSQLTSNIYTKGNKDSDIIWIEYTDLECPYCAQFNNSWIKNNLLNTYWSNLEIWINHFPLNIHDNALPAANVLECVWTDLGEDKYFELIDNTFDIYNENNTFNWEWFKDLTLDIWYSEEQLTECINNEDYYEKIEDQQMNWMSLFNISGTPWNVILNKTTWEYQVYRWLYPEEYFQLTIDKMLE